MVAALAVALAGAQTVESPKVRLDLENGATVHAERFPAEGRFALALAFRAVPETKETHGWRHLVEHLAVKDPAIDAALESRGMFLTAETGRDWTLFAVSGPGAAFPAAVEALALALAGREFADAEVRAEAKIVAEELALVEPHQAASWEAWEALFGEAGLSPFGAPASIARADAASLGRLAAQVFVGRGAAASVVGDIDPRAAAGRLRRLVGGLPQGSPVAAAPREPVRSAVAFARCVALPLPPARDPRFLATLAAAMGLASAEPGLVVGTTPSHRPGLLTLGAKSGSPADRAAAALALGPEVVAELGLRAARGWLASVTGSAEGRARLRATLLAGFGAFDPDSWRHELEGATGRAGVLAVLEDVRRAVGK